MDQLIWASLSHNHYCWYEVGMLKVPTTSSLRAAFVLLCKLKTIEDHVLCDAMAVSSRCINQ